MAQKAKKLTLLWRKLNVMELGKDVILVPYYLGKILGYQVEVCCGYPDEIAEQVNSAELGGLKFVRRNLTHHAYQRIPIYLNYLLQKAAQIDLLMCFHWKPETFINILLYRFLNKKGKIYIKLDTELGREWELSHRSFIGQFIRRKLYTALLKKIDILSCETTQGYHNLCNNTHFGPLLQKKLIYMPNAFDENRFNDLNLTKRTYEEKDNLMITVGRLGHHQKNTEMLLETLKQTYLKDWIFILIGPWEEGFEHTLEQFYQEAPHMENHVCFTGRIDDKKELWKWYDKAKVFVCTSRWESYGIVMDEAKYFSNYLVSTPVGAAQDITEEGKYGTLIAQDDVQSLSNVLTKIVTGEINTDVFGNYDAHQLSYPQRMENLLHFLQREKEEKE